MLERFLHYINYENLVEPDNKVLLGISGGIDSMVMLHLFSKAGLEFSIAHCNFNLRGNESDVDQQFLEEYAIKNNIEIFVKQFSTQDYAEKQKISIQMAARDLRVNWFEQLIEETGFSFYATAHHKDDQIETFFMNLMRSTGISGLHGILPQQGKLIHPMLFTNREEISIYASKNDIAFRQDSSNLKKDYLRNKIRHDLLPHLKSINPNYAAILTENILRFRQAELIYKQQTERIAKSLIIKEGNEIRIPIEKLQKLEPLETYLYEIVSPFNFNMAVINDIIKSLNSSSGKQFFSSTHRIVKDRQDLFISEIIDSTMIGAKFEIPKNCFKIDYPIKLELEYIDKKSKIEFTKNPDIAFLDMDKLKFPLVLRKWDKGDFFYPLGMNNRKLLSDFFIDQKFNILEKENTWILTSASKIVWIIGKRIDNRYKITDRTVKILKIYIR